MANLIKYYLIIKIYLSNSSKEFSFSYRKQLRGSLSRWPIHLRVAILFTTPMESFPFSSVIVLYPIIPLMLFRNGGQAHLWIGWRAGYPLVFALSLTHFPIGLRLHKGNSFCLWLSVACSFWEWYLLYLKNQSVLQKKRK